MKTGYKTSEFWLNLLVFILGTLLLSGIVSDGGTIAKAIGGALSLLSSLGYTASRVGVKKADSYGAAFISGPQKASNSNIASAVEDPIQESA